MPYMLDIILLTVFVFFIIRGACRGFAKIILNFARTVLAFFITAIWGNEFSRWLSTNLPGYFEEHLGVIVGYVTLFVIIFLVLTLAVHLITRLTELPLISTADHLLGMLLGTACGLLATVLLSAILSVVLTVAGKAPLVESSFIINHIKDIKDWLMTL